MTNGGTLRVLLLILGLLFSACGKEASEPEALVSLHDARAGTEKPTPTPSDEPAPSRLATPTGSPGPAATEADAAAPSPTPSPVMVETTEVSESNGIRLTLTLRRPEEYASGQRIDAALRIQNVGEETVRASGSTSDEPCDEAASIISFPHALTAKGRDWPGGWGEFKEQALTSPGKPRFHFYDERTEEQRRAGGYGCPGVGHLPYEWPPGADVTIHRFWNGRIESSEEAVDLPPSLLTVRAEFPAVVLEGSDEMHDWKPRPVTVSSKIEIRIGPDDVVGMGEAIDHALSEDRVHEWMQDRMGPGTPRGSVYIESGETYPDSPISGPYWRMEATHWTDEDHFDSLWVDVDLVTSKVLQVFQRDKIRDA